MMVGFILCSGRWEATSSCCYYFFCTFTQLFLAPLLVRALFFPFFPFFSLSFPETCVSAVFVGAGAAAVAVFVPPAAVGSSCCCCWRWPLALLLLLTLAPLLLLLLYSVSAGAGAASVPVFAPPPSSRPVFVPSCLFLAFYYYNSVPLLYSVSPCLKKRQSLENVWDVYFLQKTRQVPEMYVVLRSVPRCEYFEGS